LAVRRVRAPSIGVPSYPADLLPHVREELAALAELECRFEAAREDLIRREGPDGAGLAALRERHRAERERRVGRLAALQERLHATMRRRRANGL
jgi:hypothetical protein